ncbi:chalcone isomerase family protein [Uliginosibacterium sp. 31-16]|uniref:chalcone isomerase family protein n=1 Tax=Uliginosibacterium sp. 31-16 TaxID=3068315 RepID=UPI00273DE3EB|nr:chalcone isomerase family protein [Uliginosibacterium sp. 31-16]MDP5238078.1 chalcone isomerase family protein [Uliginosibacterium sp. 31-16]
MRLKPLLLQITLFGLSASALAMDVAGVSFEEKTRLGDSELVLNGAGMRNKLVFKAYAMGLYLPQKIDTAAGVLASKGPRRIQLVTLRDLTAEQLADALIEFVHKNHSAAELEKLNPRIETLRGIMLGIGKAPEKTRIRLDYFPASGTRVYVGNEQKGADIPGEDFYAALLKIWLGEHVPQESLRDALLGRKG